MYIQFRVDMLHQVVAMTAGSRKIAKLNAFAFFGATATIAACATHEYICPRLEPPPCAEQWYCAQCDLTQARADLASAGHKHAHVQPCDTAPFKILRCPPGDRMVVRESANGAPIAP